MNTINGNKIIADLRRNSRGREWAGGQYRAPSAPQPAT